MSFLSCLGKAIARGSLWTSLGSFLQVGRREHVTSPHATVERWPVPAGIEPQSGPLKRNGGPRAGASDQMLDPGRFVRQVSLAVERPRPGQRQGGDTPTLDADVRQ